MVTQSALKGWAKAAGCIGLALLLPLNAGAAEITGKATAAQPVGMIKPVQAPPVVKAPPVAMPRPNPTPVLAKPITTGPIAIQPVKTDPIRVVKPNVSLPAGPTKLPATPIARMDGPSAEGVSPGISAAMLEHQKQVNKEAREDRKLSKESKQLSLDAKRAKLKLDNESIQAGMDEASQKADNAMDAATTGMVVGIVTGAGQAGAGAVGIGAKAGKDADSQHREQLEDRIEELFSAQKKSLEDLARAQNNSDSQRIEQLEDRIEEISGQIERLEDLAKKLDTVDEKIKELLPQTKETGKGDAQDKAGGKAGKTVTATPVKAAGTASPKTSLISRRCTPINPC